MIPGRSYSGPYMIPGKISWQDHSKEICMICLVPKYAQIMIGLVGKPGKTDCVGPNCISHNFEYLEQFDT